MIAAFLNKPYPYFKDHKRNIISFALIGLFVSLFLIFFQPFDTGLWITPYKNLKLFGFGLISFIVPALLSFLVPVILPAKTIDERWSVYKEILLILTVLLCIAFGNLLYGRFLGTMPMSPFAYLMACTFTIAIGIFPVSMHVILKHNKFLKLNLEQTIGLNKQLQEQHEASRQNISSGYTTVVPPVLNGQLRLVAENEKDIFNIAAEQLLFIESADNYSNIVFTENGSRKKQLFRSSLKRIENQVQSQHIIRCHRTYIVNLEKIKKVEGNAAGYKLFFHDSEDFVPVSRNYIPQFNERLKGLR